MTKNLRILIAEDHQSVREGFKLIIESQENMEVVGCASDGRQAIALAEELQPDLVLMDISMPELNGLVATAKLKRILPKIFIVIITRHADEAYLRELLQAGASGYILKQSAASELIRAVQTVAAGQRYLDPLLTANVLKGFVEKKNKLRGNSGIEQLTGRESEILRQIALGYSLKDIGEKMENSIKTVESQKANSLKKLNLESRRDIIKYAMLQGWMQDD